MMTMTGDRPADTIPLRNLEAERGLIGRALMGDDAFAEMATLVTPEDFWLPEHAALWRVMLARHQRQESNDLLAVCDALERFDPRILADMHGRAGLLRLTEVQFPSVRWVQYAEQIRHYATRRAIAAAGDTITQLARDDRPVPELVADAQAAVSTLHAQHGPQVSIIDALTSRFLSDYDDRAVRTGIDGIDDVLLGGLRPAYYVLAGRTSDGKSSLMISWMQHWLFSETRSVLCVSVEMDAVTVGVRLAAARFAQSAQRMLYLKAAHLTDAEVEALEQTTARLSVTPLVLETRALKPSQIRARAHQLKRGPHGLDVIVVDYLQRLQPDRRLQNRYIEVGEMSAVMKRMSEELSVPVVALAQLSRAAVGQTDPRLEHLRESGDIEQDADCVMLLSRTDRDAKLDIAKNRNGPLRTVPLKFHPPAMRFVDGRDGVV